MRNIFDPFVSVLAAPLGRGDEDDIDEVQPQKSLVKISSLESVGERARQQDLLQQSEEKLRQHLEKAGNGSVRKASGKRGCGLGYLALRVRDQYSDESNRYNKLSVRLIGNQATALARYSLLTL